MTDTCCVVDQFCLSPANLEPQVPVRSRCFYCGEPVCTECSSRRKYLSYGRVRLCNNCQVELDGNNYFVVRRLWHKAGYSGRPPERMLWHGRRAPAKRTCPTCGRDWPEEKR